MAAKSQFIVAIILFAKYAKYQSSFCDFTNAHTRARTHRQIVRHKDRHTDRHKPNFNQIEVEDLNLYSGYIQVHKIVCIYTCFTQKHKNLRLPFNILVMYTLYKIQQNSTLLSECAHCLVCIIL